MKTKHAVIVMDVRNYGDEVNLVRAQTFQTKVEAEDVSARLNDKLRNHKGLEEDGRWVEAVSVPIGDLSDVEELVNVMNKKK